MVIRIPYYGRMHLDRCECAYYILVIHLYMYPANQIYKIITIS